MEMFPPFSSLVWYVVDFQRPEVLLSTSNDSHLLPDKNTVAQYRFAAQRTTHKCSSYHNIGQSLRVARAGSSPDGQFRVIVLPAGQLEVTVTSPGA